MAAKNKAPILFIHRYKLIYTQKRAIGKWLLCVTSYMNCLYIQGYIFINQHVGDTSSPQREPSRISREMLKNT